MPLSITDDTATLSRTVNRLATKKQKRGERKLEKHGPLHGMRPRFAAHARGKYEERSPIVSIREKFNPVARGSPPTSLHAVPIEHGSGNLATRLANQYLMPRYCIAISKIDCEYLRFRVAGSCSNDSFRVSARTRSPSPPRFSPLPRSAAQSPHRESWDSFLEEEIWTYHHFPSFGRIRRTCLFENICCV